MTRNQQPESDSSSLSLLPKLTMPHGVNDTGRLVFPEYPDVIIKLPETAVNILVILFVAWARVGFDDRGWLNRRSIHAAYEALTGRAISVDAVSKYVVRVMKRIQARFEDLGVELPNLIKRDDRGTHLARRIIIEDHTEEWKPPDEARSEARLPEQAQPGQQLNVQQQAQSTSRLLAK